MNTEYPSRITQSVSAIVEDDFCLQARMMWKGYYLMDIAMERMMFQIDSRSHADSYIGYYLPTLMFRI